MNLFLSVYYFHQSIIRITPMLTQDRLKELLHYCPETGVFTRLVGNKRGTHAGDVAGGEFRIACGKSYRRVTVCGRDYLEHRLAFLYMTGVFPEDQVDHIDGNGLNNAWINLRAVDGAENQKNKRKPANNTSGVMGVCWSRRWESHIRHAGHSKHLGYFHDKEDAIAARKEAEKKYGYHENHGTERPL
jgi:hypothetical protein